jgi:wyosine [tRNA(Phe)-imidazoG37] synthetase (radical SAM superfamily)
MPEHRFVYGPVASRRLGFSLGVDIIPFKTCTLDCVYCQLGSTGRTTVRRRSFFPPRKILAQVRAAVRSGQKIDVITFSGSGEPTLNKDIGRLIRSIKRMARIPVAVLTNGTLLTRRDVRRDLAAADIVVPSLDAVPAELFRRVNRPHIALVNGEVIDGLARFRDEYAGEIRLEIMLVRGVNHSPAALHALKAAIARIRPDRIELNTVVRPPADRAAKPLDAAALARVRRELGPRARIVASFTGKKQVAVSVGGLESAVLGTVRRRPQTASDIALALGRPPGEVRRALGALLRRRRLRKIVHSGRTYFVCGPVRFT